MADQIVRTVSPAEWVSDQNKLQPGAFVAGWNDAAQRLPFRPEYEAASGAWQYAYEQGRLSAVNAGTSRPTAATKVNIMHASAMIAAIRAGAMPPSKRD